MHRKEIAKIVKNCTYDELEEWKKHVLFCLKWYERDRNQFEIDDCLYLLYQIDKQLADMEH